MSSQHIFTKLKEFGDHYSKRDDLRTFCKLHYDEIITPFSRRVLNSDGAEILNCVFNGLPDTPPAAQKMKIKVADTVLLVMRRESTSSTHSRDVINRLCLELPRMPVESLVKWCGDSIQSIVDNKDVNMIWRDVLPECLNTLSTYDTITHCGTQMSRVEYKQQCVHTLCQCQWSDEQLVQLAAMFKDMQLPRDDHKQVINKICSYMINITPDALPPLVHQLLKLCKLHNMDIVLAHLSHYFNIHLFSKLEPPPQDSESTTIDIDDIVQHSPTELSRCLSTCIFHITTSPDPELVRRHIKMWPKLQLLRSPFMIELALALSEKGSDYAVCIDSIRSAVEQHSLDQLRSCQSAAARVVIAPDVDLSVLMKVITAESANHTELTVPGLIRLAFSLLSVPTSSVVSSSCRGLGNIIIVRLCRAQREVAPRVLTEIMLRLPDSETLYLLCKLTPVSIERCSQLTTILECVQPGIDWRPSAAVYNAVHPLLNFSTRTRDALLMICRKGLYSRNPDHRCLALSGFLTILRHIKLSKQGISSSQSNSETFSSHSCLTQMTVDLHATQQGAVVTSRVRNEAICMEVVSILRRCLIQDAAVKQLLYTNIYECVKEKTMLHESILELLYEHFVKYLPENNDVPTQLQFDKCVQVTATNAVLLEPISHLLYCICQFLQSSDDEDLEDILSSQGPDSGGAGLRNKLSGVVEGLCEGELGGVDVEDPGLTDITPESKSKVIKVQQILQCYEALIAHCIMQWNTSNNKANTVYKLFRAYNQLLELTKTPSKSNKKNKTLNDTRDSTKSQKGPKSQKSQRSQPDKNRNIKLNNLVKDRTGPFKPLPCLWGVKFSLRILELLYSESVPWSTLETLNYLRPRRDFHHFVLKSVLSVLNSDWIDKRGVVKYVVGVAGLVYRRVVCRFQDMCDFDEQTTSYCMEIFKQCLSLALSDKYALKMDAVLQSITGLTSPPADCISTILQHILSALTHIQTDNNEDNIDVVVKKLYSVCIQTAGALLELNVSSEGMNGTIIKFEEYVTTCNLDCVPLLQSILTAGAREQLETKLLDELLEKLAQLLPRNQEEQDITDSPPQFPAVNSKTAQAVLITVCTHITYRIKITEHLVNRCQCLVPPAYGSDAVRVRVERELSESHKSLLIHLCQLVSLVSLVASLGCPVGVCSDKVIQLCVCLYNVLAGFVGKLTVETAGRLRLDRLLKLSGKKFSSVVDDLIMFIEAVAEQSTAAKVLRDTKLIPRLVLAAEQYYKAVLLLGSKGKMNYQQFLSLGTARDFRIKAPLLEQVLHAREQEQEPEEDINDAATEVISQEDNDDIPTTSKRRRVS